MNPLITKIQESEKEFVEKGADLEHDRWARWQKYMHSKFYEPEDWQNLKNNHLKVLPTELLERWQHQINTPYSELSENEKESDRKETRKYLPLVRSSLISIFQANIERLEKISNKLLLSPIRNLKGEAIYEYNIGYKDAIDQEITFMRETIKSLENE